MEWAQPGGAELLGLWRQRKGTAQSSVASVLGACRESIFCIPGSGRKALLLEWDWNMDGTFLL